MNSTIHATILLFALISAPSAYARGYVIGNGGDAYLTEGGVYLTDLLESGNEGVELDRSGPVLPGLLDHLEGLDIPFAYPKLALARKLTELDARRPGIARILVLAMSFYRWRLIDGSIGRVEELESNTLRFPEADRIQAAIRLYDLIRIQAKVWALLDDLNKVALLIHEAIYALVAIEPYESPPNGSDIYYQSPRKARALVGLAFGADPENRFRDLADRYLAIGDMRIGVDSAPSSSPQWKMDLRDSNGTLLQTYQIALSDSTKVATVKKFIAESCLEAVARKEGQREYILESRLEREVFDLSGMAYDSPFGQQDAVMIAITPMSSLSFKLHLTDEPECQKSLAKYLQRLKAAGVSKLDLI